MEKSADTVYKETRTQVDVILNSKFGISWDDLPDTNSIWDWIDSDMSTDTINDIATDLVWDRMYDAGYDRDQLTKTLYPGADNG